MKTSAQHLFLILAFLAMIVAVPCTQIAFELQRGERPRVLDMFSRKPTPVNLRSFEKVLEDASLAARAIRPWMQAALFFGLREGGEKVLVGRDGWLFYRPGVSAITQRPEDADSTIGSAVEAVVDFRDQLAARGIRLLVVVAPNKESVYPDKLSACALHPRGKINPDAREFFARCEHASVEVVDLFTPFCVARVKTAEPLYLRHDTHWSPEGMRRAVEWVIISGRLDERGLIESELKPITVHHPGDLIQMQQSAVIEARVGSDSNNCEQILRRDTGKPFAFTPSSDVLLLGDSFMNIYEQRDPPGRGFPSHFARALGREISGIVMDGGGATLVRQQLARRPQLLAGKQVVVWEFTERDLRFGFEGWPKIKLPDAAPYAGQ